MQYQRYSCATKLHLLMRLCNFPPRRVHDRCSMDEDVHVVSLRMFKKYGYFFTHNSLFVKRGIVDKLIKMSHSSQYHWLHYVHPPHRWLSIAHWTTWWDHTLNLLSLQHHAITEWEERQMPSHNLPRSSFILCLMACNFGRVHTAHLTCTNADSLIVFGVNNGIRFCQILPLSPAE